MVQLSGGVRTANYSGGFIPARWPEKTGFASEMQRMNSAPE
jgi:hypothetical protein